MERRFTEQQVGEIVRRAYERQSVRGRVALDPTVGIAESEVMRIAQELGIEPRTVKLAIDEVASMTGVDTGTLQSFERNLERTVERELDEDSCGALIEEFVPSGGLTHVVKVGRSLSYVSAAGMAQCNVSLIPREGQTVLRIRSNAIFAVLATFPAALLLSGLSGAIVFDSLNLPVPTKVFLYLLVAGSIWLAAVLGFRALVRKANRKILDLTNRAAARLTPDLRQSVLATHSETSEDETLLGQQA